MSGARPREILLVEDNPGDVRLIREALSEGPVPSRVSVASDGERALEFLRRQGRHRDAPRPELILLDLNLPRMDGRELLGTIKQDAELRRIPVVVLTTSKAEDDRRRSYDLHANCYVTKPVDFDGYAAMVRGIEEFWFGVVCLPPC